jgi:septum formation protein
MLEDAGLAPRVRPPALDDGRLRPGPVAPEAWVATLAYWKARQVAEALLAEGAGADAIVLGADTVCVVDADILGQPPDAAAARAMLRAMRDRAHRTMTGACLLAPAAACRAVLVDAATVRMGAIPDDAIERYVASGDWRGKAGGYNLEERVAAGWPVACEGDPDTVMGLPMRRLPAFLERFRSEA